jgi:hypothetical protein
MKFMAAQSAAAERELDPEGDAIVARMVEMAAW